MNQLASKSNTGKTVEQRLVELEKSNGELIERTKALGKQVADLKEANDVLATEIKILKQGGNI